ncbi:hypothetical protein CFC21_049133 [Triticum aestivum]|uniref:Uncharacterized protein n=2 Tax=Triticum aestivum TaxID=4565 RepID=A0A3B6H2S4_WHEAT|nr:uncharacterized protein LOC123075127 [Triticum aestivum]KAF7039071.1 hypothetical protein CFC21_049133 [Triticum aestivum]
MKWAPKEIGQKGAPLDSVGVEKVIGTFGFLLFGSLSLYPCTVELLKDFRDTYKSFVLLSFGFIWVLVSVGVLCGLHGRSAFEQAVCRHTGRLGLLGLAALLMLHVCCALPGDTCTTILFWVLGVGAVVFHLMSWYTSLFLGEDKPEEIAATDQK